MMKPLAITGIAILIIACTPIASILIWATQSVRVDKIHVVDGLGMGVMLAIVWVLINVMMRRQKRIPQHE